MKQDIVIRNLKKSFPEFLLDVDFTIRHREMITIVGPSGCGKSTTLSLITGLIEPDQGSIAIGDEIIRIFRSGNGTSGSCSRIMPCFPICGQHRTSGTG